VGRATLPECRDGSEKPATMADRDDANRDQVVGCQLAQHGLVDIVVAERLFVLTEPEAAEPTRYIHARLPETRSSLAQNISEICGKGDRERTFLVFHEPARGRSSWLRLV
jgi:hypothetical protein